MSSHWHIATDERGILWLGLDYSCGSVNVLSSEVLTELDEHLGTIETTPPAALVLHSLKARGFIAGADVTELDGLTDVDALEQRIQGVHRTLARLEALPCPSVAMIDGFCLGGGLELALACRWRVACDDPATRIGFPEVRLGLFPGYGGSWRAIRTIGPIPAMRLMLTGRALPAKEARRLGLVDLVVPVRQLRAAALKLLADAPPMHRASLPQRLLNIAPLRPLAATVLKRQTARRVNQAHYPAPFALIEHWRTHGGSGPAVLASEAREVSRLLVGDSAQSLIRLFRLRDRLKGLGHGEHGIERVHVIGAGIMGGDIAAWAALSGRRVTLQDVSMDQLGRAMQRAHALFRKRLKDPLRVRDAWDRLIPDPGGDGLRGADLVLEAIIEDTAVKRRLFADIVRRIGNETLLATNTSGIPLESLGEGLRHPERLVGMHFFNPVARMELVEVVRGEASSPQSIDRAMAFVGAIGRLPLPVRSAPGFLVNRALMPYLLEAIELLQEGVAAEQIDRAAKAFGMPMGPIALADSVGLDICLAVAHEIGPHLSIPTEAPELLCGKVRQGLLGKKTGHGFYHWRRGRPVTDRASAKARGRPPSDLAERLIFRLLNESVACLREQIVADADLLDAGVTFGTGFAPFRGGPMHFIAQGGQERMLVRLRDLETSHGRQFHPDQGWTALQG